MSWRDEIHTSMDDAPTDGRQILVIGGTYQTWDQLCGMKVDQAVAVIYSPSLNPKLDSPWLGHDFRVANPRCWRYLPDMEDALSESKGGQ